MRDGLPRCDKNANAQMMRARENRVHVWARRILVFCRDDMNRHRDQIQDTFVGEFTDEAGRN